MDKPSSLMLLNMSPGNDDPPDDPPKDPPGEGEPPEDNK